MATAGIIKPGRNKAVQVLRGSAIAGPRKLREYRKMTCIFPEECDIIIQLQKKSSFQNYMLCEALMQKKGTDHQ